MLGDILKFCAGPKFNSLNLSKYIMSKCFSSQEENITYHYYCSQCTAVIVYSSNANNKIKDKILFVMNARQKTVLKLALQIILFL